LPLGIPLSEWPESLFAVKDNIRRKDKLLSDDIINGSAIGALAALAANFTIEVERKEDEE